MILHPLHLFSVLVQGLNFVVLVSVIFNDCLPNPECTLKCIFSLREPSCYYVFCIVLISIIVDVTVLVLQVFPQFNKSLLDVACLGTLQHHQHPRALWLQIINICSVWFWDFLTSPSQSVPERATYSRVGRKQNQCFSYWLTFISFMLARSGRATSVYTSFY